MPCDSITTITLGQEFKSIEALKNALEEMGYEVTQKGQLVEFKRGYDWGRIEQGKLTSRGARFDTNKLNKTYTTQVIKQAASKYNWRIKQDGSQITLERGF